MRLIVRMCASPRDNEAAIRFRQEHFFNEKGIKDPYVWTFGPDDHYHFQLEEENTVVGYAHIQQWPDNRAALRIIVVDEDKQGKGYGSYLLERCEQLIQEKGITLLQTEATPNAYPFYRKNGYIEMPFNNPDGEPTHPNDTAMGKDL